MAVRLVIEGGIPLRGEVRVSAAKNAALPLLAASLLSADPVVLENVPRLADIATIRTLLERLGTEIEDRDGHTVVRTPALQSIEAPYDLVSLGGLAAAGTTEVSRVYHLDRGYEGMEQKLLGLGARVRREG